MADDLTVVIPVYNEEEIIGEVANDWLKHLEALNIDFHIHFYNDGSKDKSLDALNRISKSSPRVKVIDKKNSGHGPTILKGYREATSEFVFQVDSDNEMRAEHFSTLWNNRMNNDFIIGQRKFEVAPPLPRRIVSFVAKKMVRSFYGKGIRDVNVPYRLMRRASFKEIFDKIPDDTFAPNVIISGMATKHKMRISISEVQSKFRETGVVSIQKWKLFKMALRSFNQSLKFSFRK